MANILPTVIAANYASDGTNITIPISDFPALTTAEADAASGDGRELARALCEAIYANITALATASRPTQMTVSKASPQGIGTDVVRQSYTFTFDLNIAAENQDLVAEA